MQDELSQLLLVISRTLPRLAGRVGAPDRDQLRCGDAQNPARLAALYDLLQRRYPEAGPHYWRVHSWNQLIWQPIYLSLIAVHLGHRAPVLPGMGQSLRDDLVSGYCLPAHRPLAGTPEQLIDFCAGQLKRLLAQQLDELGGLFNFSSKLAYLLVQDCLRGALLFVEQPLQPGHQRLRALERLWLNGLALDTGSGLLLQAQGNGEQVMAVQRRTCCQYFRRADGELCGNCPRLRPQQRAGGNSPGARRGSCRAS